MRYDNSAPVPLVFYNQPGPLEAKAFVSGTVQGDAGEVGWTPFQMRAFCEMYKILKPRKVFLQGGQSYTFKFKMSRPFHLTYGRFGTSLGTVGSFAKVTRGLLITANSIPVSDSMDDTDIAPGAGALDCYFTKTYEWVAAPMPHHYSDFVTTFPTVNAAAIIQPQTGAINPNALST